MSDDIVRKRAKVLFDRAYRHHMKGEVGDAIALYKRSLTICPTAEAYTFLGWSYSLLNRHDEAIAACHEAITLDPDFGNPYNDIGAYLIQQEKWAEAVPWFEKAIAATRYDSREFPYLNMGRAYERLGRYQSALDSYDRALAIEPLYRNAIYAKYQLLGRMN